MCLLQVFNVLLILCNKHSSNSNVSLQKVYSPSLFSIFKSVSTMIDYFSADNNSSFNENTRYPSSGPYRSWHFPKSDHLNLSGNRGNKFYSNNVWKKR